MSDYEIGFMITVIVAWFSFCWAAIIRELWEIKNILKRMLEDK